MGSVLGQGTKVQNAAWCGNDNNPLLSAFLPFLPDLYCSLFWLLMITSPIHYPSSCLRFCLWGATNSTFSLKGWENPPLSFLLYLFVHLSLSSILRETGLQDMFSWKSLILYQDHMFQFMVPWCPYQLNPENWPGQGRGESFSSLPWISHQIVIVSLFCPRPSKLIKANLLFFNYLFGCTGC